MECSYYQEKEEKRKERNCRTQGRTKRENHKEKSRRRHPTKKRGRLRKTPFIMTKPCFGGLANILTQAWMSSQIRISHLTRMNSKLSRKLMCLTSTLQGKAYCGCMFNLTT